MSYSTAQLFADCAQSKRRSRADAQMFARVWDAITSWARATFDEGRGIFITNFIKLTWYKNSHLRRRERVDLGTLGVKEFQRPVAILLENFRKTHCIEYKHNRKPPLENHVHTEEVNWSKLAIKFSQDLNKDQVFSCTRDLVQRLGEVLAEGRAGRIDFGVGSLVFADRAVDFEWGHEYHKRPVAPPRRPQTMAMGRQATAGSRAPPETAPPSVPEDGEATWEAPQAGAISTRSELEAEVRRRVLGEVAGREAELREREARIAALEQELRARIGTAQAQAAGHGAPARGRGVGCGGPAAATAGGGAGRGGAGSERLVIEQQPYDALEEALARRLREHLAAQAAQSGEAAPRPPGTSASNRPLQSSSNNRPPQSSAGLQSSGPAPASGAPRYPRPPSMETRRAMQADAALRIAFEQYEAALRRKLDKTVEHMESMRDRHRHAMSEESRRAALARRQNAELQKYLLMQMDVNQRKKEAIRSEPPLVMDAGRGLPAYPLEPLEKNSHTLRLRQGIIREALDAQIALKSAKEAEERGRDIREEGRMVELNRAQMDRQVALEKMGRREMLVGLTSDWARQVELKREERRLEQLQNGSWS
eukprot:tig00021035_g17257.t1